MDAAAAQLLSEVRPGGVCLFSRNIREAEQTRELLDGIRSSLKVDPILAVDQEGGLVDRLRRLVAPMPAASQLRTADDAAALGSIIAETLRLLGFNLDFAPVIDVATAGRGSANNGIFSRTFGSTKESVSELAGAFLKSLEAGGVVGCLKHFPGLGAASVDSHEELPVVEIDREELVDTDLYPYRELLPRAGAVMVAHAAFPNFDLQEVDQNGKLLPSSLSYAVVTELLRNKMGFTGASITDDLEMGAILKNYGIGEACRMALQAGEDLLAICADPERIITGYRAVLDAVAAGTIEEERIDRSLARIAQLKNKLSPALEYDSARLAALSREVEVLKEDLA